jgi:hypothetical protein
MPSLDFKGKQFVHSHHLSVSFRELVVASEQINFTMLMEDSWKKNLESAVLVPSNKASVSPKKGGMGDENRDQFTMQPIEAYSP